MQYGYVCVSVESYRTSRETLTNPLLHIKCKYPITWLFILVAKPGCVSQSVGHPTHKSEVLGSIPSLATYFLPPSADSRGAVVTLLAKLCARSTG